MTQTASPSDCTVWIIVLNYNGLTDTRRCLASLEAARANAEILVVDNGSTIDEAALIETEFPWAHTLRNDENLGYAGGNNRGIEFAFRHEADWVIVLNNDTIVDPSLPRRLMAAADAHPDYGIIGPVIAYMDEPDHVRSDGTVFNVAGSAGFFERLPVPLRIAQPPSVADVDIVNGCCMMLSRRLVDRIGLIDERFFLVHEESDFCLRAIEAGFRCGVVAETLVWHKGSSSFKRSGHGLQRYFDARNLALLLRKHSDARPRRRRQLSSWYEYSKYTYFLYCLEREGGTDTSALAVVEGLYDGLTGSWGPRVSARRRRWLPLLRTALDAKRRLRFGNGASPLPTGAGQV
jgi:GT2 family glycosyltransferase